MHLQVFLPQRRIGETVKVGRLYRGRYRLEGDSKPTEIALGVTDENEARQGRARQGSNLRPTD